MKKTILLLIGILLLISCTKEYGTLDGKITIGPLCPIEMSPKEAQCIPSLETYKEWPISVYDSKNRKVTTLHGDEKGAFSLRLEVASYRLDVDSNRNLENSGQYSLMVNIKPNETTTVKLDIDTGIR